MCCSSRTAGVRRTAPPRHGSFCHVLPRSQGRSHVAKPFGQYVLISSDAATAFMWLHVFGGGDATAP